MFPQNLHSLIPELTQELIHAHGAHTIILYGSRAHGTETAASDIDILCFRADPEAGCDARQWQGYWLDAWLYPETAADKPEDFLHLQGGRVLAEQDGFGHKLLARIDTVLAEPYKGLSDQDVRHRRAWLSKTLARAGQGDSEGWYRRHMLIKDLLEIHFELQRWRFLGFKRAMLSLQAQDPELHTLFMALYSAEPSLELITTVVEQVLTQSD